MAGTRTVQSARFDFKSRRSRRSPRPSSIPTHPRYSSNFNFANFRLSTGRLKPLNQKKRIAWRACRPRNQLSGRVVSGLEPSSVDFNFSPFRHPLDPSASRRIPPDPSGSPRFFVIARVIRRYPFTRSLHSRQPDGEIRLVRLKGELTFNDIRLDGNYLFSSQTESGNLLTLNPRLTRFTRVSVPTFLFPLDLSVSFRPSSHRLWLFVFPRFDGTSRGSQRESDTRP